MNILLANLPLFFWPSSSYPSIYYIKGFLKAKGFTSVRTVDLNVEFFHEVVDRFRALCTRKSARKALPGHFFSGADRDIQEALRYLTLPDIPYDPVLARAASDSIMNAFDALDLLDGGLFHDDRQSTHFSSVLRSARSLPSRHYLYQFYRRQILAHRERTGSFPDFIGLSLVDATLAEQPYHALLLARAAKELAPRAHVCWGGPLISKILHRPVWRSAKTRSRYFGLVDSYAAYEAEVSSSDFLEHLAQKGRIEKAFPFFVTREHDMLGAEDTERPSCNWDPDYEDLPFDKLFNVPPSVVADRSTRYVSLLSSRGCSWRRCTFCSSHFIYAGAYQPLNVARTVDAIERVEKEHGCRFIRFNDEAMSAPIMEALSRELLRRNLSIRWSTNIRVDRAFLQGDLLSLAHKAGFSKALIGIETASPRLLRLMKKGYDLDVATALLQQLRSFGIAVQAYLIVGFPGETAADLEMTYRFLLEHRPAITNVYVHHFSVEEHAPLFQTLNRKRRIRYADLSVSLPWQHGVRSPEREALMKKIFFFAQAHQGT